MLWLSRLVQQASWQQLQMQQLQHAGHPEWHARSTSIATLIRMPIAPVKHMLPNDASSRSFANGSNHVDSGV